MSARILVIEDETRVAHAIERGLRASGFEIVVGITGEEGYFLLSSQAFDLVILDLMLPGRDGLEILRTVRRQGSTVPILILSARDTVADRVNGLELGADDYLVKPFAFEELLARIRVLLRRGQAHDVLRLTVADLELDRMTRRVTRAGAAVDLTAREYELLEYLILNHGRVVSREMLVRDVWHEVQRATPLDNVIDVHIARLRKKIDQGERRPLIHTLRGVGFMLGESPP